MPRYADHEERREELADTARALILENGIDHVSVRNVAQASGWSVGAIRYYFPRQEDLLTFALKRTSDEAYNRSLQAEKTHLDDPMSRVKAMLQPRLPNDERSRTTLRVWTAFLDRGLTNPEFANQLARVWKDGRFLSRRMICVLMGQPLLEDREAPLEDPFLEETAAVLHVIWDGMALQGLMYPGELNSQNIDAVTRRSLDAIAKRLETYPDGRVTG